MQYVVIARDHPEKGLERRLAVREQHVVNGNKLRDTGNFLYGVAILDEQDTMRGSVMIMDFSSRSELDAWLKTEPYVVNNVWETIEVLPCRVGPSFATTKEQEV